MAIWLRARGFRDEAERAKRAIKGEGSRGDDQVRAVRRRCLERPRRRGGADHVKWIMD